MNEFLEKVIELASLNVDSGGRPFACVIVKNGKILAEAVNEYDKGDPTAHAELLAIRKVIETKGKEQLMGSEFYLLCHPCPMCVTAIIYCNPERVVFATERESFAQFFKAGYKHATYSNLYEEVSKPWEDRKLPMQHAPHPKALQLVQRWKNLQETHKKIPEKQTSELQALSHQTINPVFELPKEKCPFYDPRFANSIFQSQRSELINTIVSPSSNYENMNIATRSINTIMRDAYQKRIQWVGRNTFPLIIARDNETGYEGVGSTFTLYLEDGSTKWIAPAKTKLYETHKNISHIPLALFSIVSPYFYSSTEKGWVTQLESFDKVLNNIIILIKQSGLAEEIRMRYLVIMNKSRDYITRCLSDDKIDSEIFSDYSREIFSDVRENLKIAVKEQIESATKELLKWKEQLGEEKWKKLYVVIPTVWTVSDKSPRQLIMENLMEAENVSTNLIIAQGISDVEGAKTLLGRIVYDRAAANFIVGIETEETKLITLALSSPTDIATLDAQRVIAQLNKEGSSTNLRAKL